MTLIAPGLLESPMGSQWSLVDSAFTQIAIGAGTGNTITMPTFAAGDLLVYWDFTDANSSTPSGWTTRNSTNFRVRTKVSTGGETLTNTTAPSANYDIMAMVASFRHAGGLTPTFVKDTFLQRIGSTEFPLAGITAGGTSYEDCLVVYCSQKSLGGPTNTTATWAGTISLRSGSTIMNTKIIRAPENDYYPVTTGFCSHLGGAYATGHDASAVVDEFRFDYSQWHIGRGGDAGNASTMVWRGV